jgi:hypothetical protein
MTTQWPGEHERLNRPPLANDSFKTEESFRQLLDVLPDVLPEAFDDAVDWVTRQGDEITELERRALLIEDQISLPDLSDGKDLLMTWVCVTALARSPSLQTWEKVNTLKCNSWSLAYWLGYAMEVRAERDSDAREAYIELAKMVFDALDSFTLVSKFDSVNRERKGALAYWKESRSKLDDIWWGLRDGRNLLSYEEELPLFQMFSRLEPNEFVRFVARSGNPYFVHSLLLVFGMGTPHSCFSDWEKVSVIAPVAFGTDASWNGSVLAPLILVEARNQLLQGQRNALNPNVSDAEFDEVKQELVKLAELVVTILAGRKDAVALFARWSTWLMRQLLRFSQKDIGDVRSAAFVDSTLLEAIGRKLRNQVMIQTTPSDAPTWEAWCYRCVLAFHAHSGFIDPPDRIAFFEEWAISPDEWSGIKGQRLREHASMVVITTKEMPGVAANLLAYPTVQLRTATEEWIAMWHSTHALREIVEFGDPDASEDEYQSRTEAGKLLLFAFRVGLAIFDQRAAQCSSSTSPEARSQAKLHEALTLGVREMREIDITLSRDEWINADRHLAIRRLIWEERVSGHRKQERPAIFSPGDTPAFSDYLGAAKGDVIELVGLLESALLNDPDIAKIQDALRSASIELSDILEIAKQLNHYNPRKYPINESQLKRIQGLN